MDVLVKKPGIQYVQKKILQKSSLSWNHGDIICDGEHI